MELTFLFFLFRFLYSRKKEWARTLDKQVVELHARKKREGASMNDTEIRLNRLSMNEAETYMRKNPRKKPREIVLKTQPW